MTNEKTTIIEKSDTLLEDVQSISENRKRIVPTLSTQLTKQYCKRILPTLSTKLVRGFVASLTRQLESKYGPVFREKNVRRMMQFATEQK